MTIVQVIAYNKRQVELVEWSIKCKIIRQQSLKFEIKIKCLLKDFEEKKI